jgi:GTPase SAR1 family protein
VTNTALIADNNVNIFSPSKVNVSQCTSRTIKLNRDIYKFILDIASKISYTNSVVNKDTVILKPKLQFLNYSYYPVSINPGIDIIIDNFNDINICYFQVNNTTNNTPIVVRHNDSTTTFKADNVVIIIHNDIIKIQIYYKMTFDYDVESSIITDCFFETNLVGTFDSNYSTYVNNNYVLQDIFVLDPVTSTVITLNKMYTNHQLNMITKFKNRVNKLIKNENEQIYKNSVLNDVVSILERKDITEKDLIDINDKLDKATKDMSSSPTFLENMMKIISWNQSMMISGA